jgi:predicted lipid carrier protein YhbT
MLNLAVPTPLSTLIARLPAAPPSWAFSLAANRLLWPALKTLDWQPLLGRRYAICVKDLGLTLHFTVTRRGFAPDSGTPDLTISATARDFLLLGLTVKNLLDALDPELVLHRLPAPLARAAQRWMTA